LLLSLSAAGFSFGDGVQVVPAFARDGADDPPAATHRASFGELNGARTAAVSSVLVSKAHDGENREIAVSVSRSEYRADE